MSSSMFEGLDRERFIDDLRRDGVAFGLTLPAALIAELVAFAAAETCYADRDTTRGFRFRDHAKAELALGKPILVAQYFNAERQCAAVSKVVADPMLQWVATRYLGSVPAFVGSNLWWTFPVEPTESDKDLHAHLFHRDVDDFRFLKFFFYLTDVAPGDGAHICVIASHGEPPNMRVGDRWSIRRYSNVEIEQCFGSERIVEICGPAGTGFAENTLCVHKGLTPSKEPRLLLQLQYALFDYGAMHDRREPASLRTLV
jgi:hypothetical protein